MHEESSGDVFALCFFRVINHIENMLVKETKQSQRENKGGGVGWGGIR